MVSILCHLTDLKYKQNILDSIDKLVIPKIHGNRIDFEYIIISDVDVKFRNPNLFVYKGIDLKNKDEEFKALFRMSRNPVKVFINEKIVENDPERIIKDVDKLLKHEKKWTYRSSNLTCSFDYMGNIKPCKPKFLKCLKFF
jgi:hypothetical protein